MRSGDSRIVLRQGGDFHPIRFGLHDLRKRLQALSLWFIAPVLGARPWCSPGCAGRGSRVPDGFVVFAATFTTVRDALKETAQPTVADVLNHPLDPSVRDAIVTAAGRLGGRLTVRSSGVDEDGERASPAGQYSTVLVSLVMMRFATAGRQ
jgi:hypothetical protein